MNIQSTAKKLFVLDTNVLMHDPTSIFRFQEHNIFIPMVVLEELDHFKKGNEQLNFNARQFTRELDDLVDDNLFSSGASLGDEKGHLFILAKKGSKIR